MPCKAVTCVISIESILLYAIIIGNVNLLNDVTANVQRKTLFRTTPLYVATFKSGIESKILIFRIVPPFRDIPRVDGYTLYLGNYTKLTRKCEDIDNVFTTRLTCYNLLVI